MTQKPSNSSDLTPWKTLGETLISNHNLFSLHKRQFEHPTRLSKHDFYVLKFTDWALAIPLTSDRKIILVNQFRYGTNSTSWELPGGTLDTDENPITGATRELLEETGFTGQNPTLIGSCSANPAIQNNKAHFVLYTNCSYKQAPQWDETEEIQTQAFPLETAFEMALNGKIHHTISITALFFLKNYLQQQPIL